MELSPRLRAVADWVPQGASLADVGTDHGFLPVWLIQQNRISRAIAADLRSGPLESAQRNAERFGLSDRLSFRLCDGLSGIAPGEADTVTIAGMGGETIAGILKAAPWTVTEGTLLILQPQSAFDELRGFLFEYGYNIIREKIIREGKRLYNVMEVRAGVSLPMGAGELWAGRNSNDNDPLRGEYLDWIGGILKRSIAGKRCAVRQDEAELKQLEQALQDIEEMKKEWAQCQR